MRDTAIHHNFNTGQITGTRIIERIGMELMRGSAYLLVRYQFLGFSYAARLVRSIFKSDRQVQVKIAEDSIFEYPYGDGYWGVLLYNKRAYAPDVEPYLKSFADIDYSFIDCGSNFGYMSVLVSSKEYGSKPCIAIEADPENYARTVRNSELNGNRYECLHNAISDESGNTVNLYGAKHEAFSIVDEGDGSVRAEVKTLALNDLDGWLTKQGSGPTILKLDVEGVEIDALKGAGKMLQGDCLVQYEEHGCEETHEVSRYLKEQLGMRLFLGDEDGSHMQEITTYEELDAMKVNARYGYDLFAASSQFWIDRLENLNRAKRSAS